MCQRRLRRPAVALLLAGIATAAMAGPDDRCAGLFNPEPSGGIQALSRRLATGLELPEPAQVEIAPIPDSSAGVTFGPAIRLRPAPQVNQLAALMHEAGHLGPVRSRDVEEAVADLTRRALLAAWLAEGDPAAAALLPVLVAPPPPPNVPWETSVPGESPLSPILYRRAAVLAATLWQAAVVPGEAGDVWGVAARLSRAARLGRRLSSAEIHEGAQQAVRAGSASDLLRQFREEHVGTLLAAALPLAGRHTAGLERLLAALEQDSGPAWMAWAAGTLSGDDADRIFAHEVMAMRRPGDGGELEFLGRWLARAAAEGDMVSRHRALVRRGEALVRAGRVAAAERDLLQVVWDGASPLLTIEALVHLAGSTGMTPEVLLDFLDAAPALATCGSAGTALRALALSQAGHHEAALVLFPRGVPAAFSWGYTASWVESLAAVGRSVEAVALLRRYAAMPALRPALQATALMTAVIVEGDGEPQQAAAAARALRRAGGWPDRMLSEEARRWEALGRTKKSEQAWRELRRRTPTSDLVPAP